MVSIFFVPKVREASFSFNLFPDFVCKFDLTFSSTKECGGKFCARFRRVALSFFSIFGVLCLPFLTILC